MATADSVKAKIQGLITAANTKTGNSDADLTTAVNTLIDGFGQGGVELPEIDASVLGTANDLASGKQLIDADGNVVIGNVETVESTSAVVSAIFSKVMNGPNGSGKVYVESNLGSTKLFRTGGRLLVDVPASNFGDARPEDVVAGKTFTSASGLNVAGTVSDKRGGLTSFSENPQIYTVASGSNYIVFDYKPTTTTLVRDGIMLGATPSKFGDASAEDVVKGKTFTSANGLKVEGTHECNGGFVIKTGTTTSRTINTGLSEIEEFYIYKQTQTAVGLIHLRYSKTGGTNYLYASVWSTINSGTKTVTSGTTGATVNGGSITIPQTTAANGGLSSGVTYAWVAVGTE